MEHLTQKLRVGILMCSFDIPAWAHVMLDRIKRSDYAQIVLVVLNDRPPGQTRRQRGSGSRWDTWLYRLYTAFDRARYKPQPDALEIRDAACLLADVPTLKVVSRKTTQGDDWEDENIRRMEAYDIDVFIHLGSHIPGGRILQVPRYGVWSYHYSGDVVNRHGPPGFWEVFKYHPTTESILYLLSEGSDNGTVLCRSYSATNRLSVELNRNNCLCKSLSFAPRKLAELHRIGGERFFSRARKENGRIGSCASNLCAMPRDRELWAPLLRYAVWRVKTRFISVFHSCQWILLFGLGDGVSTCFRMFKRLVPPRDRFWADPFVVQKSGLYYVFMEEFDYAKEKGHISVLTIDKNGNHTQPVKILERPYHLSYPFVFEWDGSMYMIPESAGNRTLDVYRCTEFPQKWEFHKTLMKDVAAFDGTLLQHRGKWWLFVNIRENDGASGSDELFLFYADNPLADSWRHHPKNPVVSDVRRSRPAGKIFERNGSLYRPSQNCSTRYGYGLKINQILVLSETDYQEKEVDSIEPKWDKNIIGVHTFNQAGRLTVIDGLLKRPKLPWDKRGPYVW
ncbi:MAG: hypothetical protein AB1696_02835 [Planctomycetota bacterium]